MIDPMFNWDDDEDIKESLFKRLLKGIKKLMT
jgi:hypothetical protein